jgi:hypothetical protein
MRIFYRHPSEIPIDFHLEQLVDTGTDYLKNVSHGGLAFRSTHVIPTGSLIRVRIPLLKPVFEAVGRVTWCRPCDQSYEVGVEFVEAVDAFRIRMVEQVCQIEHYRQAVMTEQGRKLSSEQAAVEWIAKFAGNFPANR